jgi:hypothetical protein
MSRSRSQNQNQTLGFAQCQAWKPRTIAVASRGLIHRARCAGRTGVRLAAALGRRSPAGRRGVPRVCPAQARLRPAAEGGGLSLAQSGPARASVTAPLSAGRQRAAPHTLPCRLGDGHGGGRRAGGWGHSARAGEPAAAVGAGRRHSRTRAPRGVVPALCTTTSHVSTSTSAERSFTQGFQANYTNHRGRSTRSNPVGRASPGGSRTWPPRARYCWIAGGRRCPCSPWTGARRSLKFTLASAVRSPWRVAV